jgi:hypothetical protein
VHGSQLSVRGTIEQHEAVAEVLGLTKRASRPAGRTKTLPLERQSFTLQAQNVTLRELIDELTNRGIAIRYDAAALRKSGVDLDRRVSIDVDNLPAREFFGRLFDPHGLKFRFDKGTVVVESRESTKSE